MVVTLSVTVLAGYPILVWLRHAGLRQNVSTDAPERHAAKQGTPTMGGVMMAVGVLAACLVLAILRSAAVETTAVLCLTGVFGCIGLLDDVLIVRRGRNLGLTARQKLALQFAAAIAFCVWLYMERGTGIATYVGGVRLGLWYYPLAALLIVGLSNATNLADGLDGLSAGMSLIALVGLTIMASATSIAALLVAGACAGILWFNTHPALVFMGNTGALALGAALAAIGIMGRVELPSQLAVIVFWAETVSVMAQVAVFKWRKRMRGIEYARAHRLFRRAPLHHHLEEIGWPETRIVGRLWIATGAATALAVIWCRTGWF